MRASELKGCTIGIDLVSGIRIIGKVHRWTKSIVWLLEEDREEPIDIPRDIIVRALVLLKGDLNDE